MPTWSSPWEHWLDTPNIPTIRFTWGVHFVATLVRNCYGLPGCSPPWTDLTGIRVQPQEAFTSRLSTERSPLPSLDITTTSIGLLCRRDLHPLEWQLASLHAPDDREPVCRFLEEAFPESGIKAATWRRLFDHGWSDHGRGFVLLDGNAVVGFIGSIAARRQVNGQAALVCNISSWSVHAKYRGWGMALLAAVLRDESLTYTSFTPNPAAWAALLAQRFTLLSSHRIVMPYNPRRCSGRAGRSSASIRPRSARG